MSTVTTNWIQLLPPGVTRPLVINLVFPAKWRKGDDGHGKPTGEDQASQKQAVGLVKNPNYIKEREAISKQFNADHVTVLSNPVETTDPTVYATVYFPTPDKGIDLNASAGAVMEWFKSSLLGKIYHAQGHQNKMGNVVSTGKGYETVDSLTDLKLNVDSDDYTHSTGHCVCH